MRLASAFLLTLAVVALPAQAATPVSEAAVPRGDLLPGEQNAIGVYDGAVRSVVQIEATWIEAPRPPIKGLEQLYAKPVGEPQRHRTIGTGVVWDGAGHIVTMAQVAASGSTFTLTFADGSHRQATLVGTDPTVEITVLKLDAPSTTLHPISPGSSRSLRVGQRLYVIGSAFGRVNVLTEGMLGAVESTMSGTGHPSLILNATVNPGNAGGPILDTAGQVVGLIGGNYANGSSTGYALGLPIDDIAAVVPRLVADGHVDHPRLGISIQEGIGADLPAGLPSGVAVIATNPGGAGERAGLKARDGDTIDVITALDGVEIRSWADLRAALDKHRTGDHCTLTVWRGGKTRILAITLEADKR